MAEDKISWKDAFIGFLIAMVLVFAWLFLGQKYKNKLLNKANHRLKKQNEHLKAEYLDLVGKLCEIEDKITPDITAELNELKEKAKQLDSLVHIELTSVTLLVQNGEHEKAVKDLAKIIENVLKLKTQQESDFKGKPTLNNLIQFAEIKQWFNREDIYIAHCLREVRNQVSHELAVKRLPHENGFYLFGGIKLIYRLYDNK
ncbi:MAG: hypothetical protein HWD84_10545 [Flavobacteriaceae bacterium]|nr:hypothetical protein [Flavobacteriaceae bacterium]